MVRLEGGPANGTTMEWEGGEFLRVASKPILPRIHGEGTVFSPRRVLRDLRSDLYKRDPARPAVFIHQGVK